MTSHYRLRFVKNNSKNQREFNDIVQNESIDTYKRRILGADTVDEESAFWAQFEGGKDSADVQSAAFKHEAYAQKYRDDFGAEKSMDEIDDEIDLEYRVVRSYHMSEDVAHISFDEKSKKAEPEHEPETPPATLEQAALQAATHGMESVDEVPVDQGTVGNKKLKDLKGKKGKKKRVDVKKYDTLISQDASGD
eukprot:SAG11_NODE_209_length_12331_cov_3.126226_4_plen_193_part_00